MLATLVVALASAAGATEFEEPCTGSDDWVRLTSSEWLKGNLRRMRSRNVEFWSQEMKTLRFEWKKVAELCMGHEARFVTEGYVVFRGYGIVRDDHVVIETSEGKVRFPRAELMAILPRTGGERDKWGFKIGVGVDANVGNTEQTAINANLSINREDRWTRGKIAYSGSFGTADGDENINRHRLEGKLDWFFTRHLYWSIVDIPVLYDKFQNLDVRVTPSTLLGWQVFDLAGFVWNVEAGIGYQYTDFISVEPPQDASVSDAAIRLSTNFKWDIVNDLELKFRHDTILVPTDMGQTSLYSSAVLKYELTDLLKLETTLVHSRIWEPVPTADGTQPESDDFQLIVGFAFEVY